MTISPQLLHIIYYALGLVATKIVSLIVLPIMTHLITPVEYGNLEILLTFINLALIVLGFGLSEALFRFGGMARSRKFMNKVCANAAMLALIIGVLLCSPIIIFAPQVSKLLPGNITTLQVIYLGLALIPCNVLAIQLDWLRLKDDARQFVLVSFFRSLLQAILLLSALYAGYGVTGIMFATAVTTILTLAYFLLFQMDAPLEFNKPVQKKLFFYGLPLSFNGMAEFILMSLSNWWLAYDVGAAAMAPFALAMKFAIMISFFIYPFYMWWGPERYKHLETQEDKKYTALMSEMGVAVSYFGAYLVSLGGGLIILWFIPDSYHEALVYLPLACFMMASRYGADMTNVGLFIERPNYIMYINSVVALLTMIGFYFFIPLWHAWGAFFVLQITLLLRWLAYLYFSQRELYLPYRYLRLLLFMSVCVACGVGIDEMENVWVYIGLGGLVALLLIGLAYLLELLPELKKQGKY